MSLAGRMFNILATPGDVFSQVKASKPNLWNWFAPAILLLVIGWIGATIIFSQDSIRQQLNEITARATEKQIERSHMSKEQAEQVRAMSEKVGGIATTVGAYGYPVFEGVIMPLIWGLVIWLVGTKAMRGNFGFVQALEVAGLALMILALDSLLKSLLVLATGNIFAAPGPSLLIKEFDPQNPLHSLMVKVDALTFWALAIRALGLARLSGRSFARAAAWIFGLWFAYTGVMFGIGFAFQRLFTR